ncbi:hypothetical protein BV22DRAFT_1133046 [Leucogyrophana mollusca]|uniref:Uncharacterized protein n=1 Tax=Leucogyrophana mollusca TaxID=85980 RepID=A0ACB8B4I7_9AGAM|nr:hypothetical protein BV22DRAFT_1133046 [Leucogyrophana mollusca]
MAVKRNPSALDVGAFVRAHARIHTINRQRGCREVLPPPPRDMREVHPGPLEIKSGRVYRDVLWILGEYVEDIVGITVALQGVRKILGEIPILASEQRLLDEAGGEAEGEDKDKVEAKTEGSGGRRPRVLADGTYAAETACTSASSARLEAVKAASMPPLRALILGGDFFTGAVLPSTLTKLVLCFDELTSGRAKANAIRAEVRELLGLMHLWSKFVTVPIDEDSNERIPNCIQTLSELREAPAAHNIFLKDTKAAYSKMLGAQEKKAAGKRDAESIQVAAAQVDDLLTFRRFSKKLADDPTDYVEDLGEATGTGEVCEDFISNLSRISQLAGFSDPIYAEAYVKARGFDILLDVLLVNQAPNTLQNLCLDFATLGDRKLVERPAVHTIAPHGFQSIKATIKVCPSVIGACESERLTCGT